MTTEQFAIRWREAYPETVWLAHLFRHAHPDRWFRIHSLPDSKRYANTVAEWTLLLDRQNILLTDLLGNNAEVTLVSGEYLFDDVDTMNTGLVSEALATLSFLPTGQRANLHELYPDDYEPGIFYQSKFSEQIWQPHKFDELLRDIADDQTGVFFISWHNACIIAPYDGGVDVLLKNSATRDYYRAKYRAWLSSRPDGLLQRAAGPGASGAL